MKLPVLGLYAQGTEVPGGENPGLWELIARALTWWSGGRDSPVCRHPTPRSAALTLFQEGV